MLTCQKSTVECDDVFLGKGGMKILFCGDVVARSGREVILKYVPLFKKKWSLDCVIVNGENAQHCFGLSSAICSQFYQAGVDVITMGNHTWDHKEMISYIDSDPRVIRPINYPDTVPGKGYYIHSSSKGNVLVINAMGQNFISPVLDNPFIMLDNFLKKNTFDVNNIRAIVIDFHAETTSEKVGLGYYLDGRVSLVVGTHTHIPTADAHILPKGTAFMTDAGMCGDYASIIGASLEAIPYFFLKKIPVKKRFDPAAGPGTLCGVYLETDDSTGLAKMVYPVCLGALLEQKIPPCFADIPLA